jgi:hypothetical protein
MSFFKKESLITKVYPKVKMFHNKGAYPFGERFLGHGLLTGNRKQSSTKSSDISYSDSLL